jgi:hypothetical protein
MKICYQLKGWSCRLTGVKPDKTSLSVTAIIFQRSGIPLINALEILAMNQGKVRHLTER